MSCIMVSNIITELFQLSCETKLAVIVVVLFSCWKRQLWSTDRVSKLFRLVYSSQTSAILSHTLTS